MLPTSFRTQNTIVGSYVNNRDPLDQPLFDRLAEQYFDNDAYRYLNTVFPGKKLKFDVLEAQQLHSRANTDIIQGIANVPGTAAIGYPIIQFYDFVLTIDELLAYLRNLDIQVKNIQPFGEIINRDGLKQSILPPSYIPWVFEDIIRKDQSKENVEMKKHKTFRLGSNTRLGFATIHNEIIPKSDFDKSVDEAYMLNNPVLEVITALSQGLFKIFQTDANILTSTVNVATDNRIPKYHWINTFSKDEQWKRPKVQNEVLEHEKQLFLQPKLTNMNLYKLNFLQYHSLFFTIGDKQGENTPVEFGRNGDDLLIHSNNGGAIGLYNVFTDRDDIKWINTIDLIYNAMEKMGDSGEKHPIYACHKLSKAFRSVGIAQVLLNMYYRIQTEFDAKLKQSLTDSLTADIRQTAQIAGQSTGSYRVRNCPANHIPQYRDYDGKIVDPDHAVFIQNGIKWLKSNIDPSRSSCVPLISAPMTTLPSTIKGLGHIESRSVVKPTSAVYTSEDEIQRLLRSNISMESTPNTNFNLLQSLTTTASDIRQE